MFRARVHGRGVLFRRGRAAEPFLCSRRVFRATDVQDSVLRRAMASGGGGGCAEHIDEEPRGPPPVHPHHRPPAPPSGDQDQLADYDFVEEPAKEFFCAVTLELLVEPQQTDCCGHHISAEVARRLLGEGKACPMCQQPRFTTHPDKFHGRKIRQLIVCCPNKKSGCGWEGELGDVEAHVGRCPKQPWRCPHCAFVGLQEGGEEHLRVCEQFPVACPNRCERACAACTCAATPAGVPPGDCEL